MKSVKILLACLVAILVFSTLAYAEVPKMINYQGKITTPQGALISDTFSMVFSIYTDSTGGTPLWTETQPSVKVEYGVFSVLLGSVNPIPATVFDGNTRYLGLKVGSDNEMAPRKAIVSVGYAYHSLHSDTADFSNTVIPPDNSVSQAILKTAIGEVSRSAYQPPIEQLILPGGQYGFYPQVKGSSGTNGRHSADIAGTSGMDWWIPQTNYITTINLRGEDITFYAQQRYVSSSGKDHWMFFLIDKNTNQILASYQAPDHPCYGQGGDETEIPHPFVDYFNKPLPDQLGIILVDNEILPKLKSQVTRKRSLLTIINEDYEVDQLSSPVYTPREIVEIDEFGDRRGEVIKVFADGKELKRRLVETLPSCISYKKLKPKSEVFAETSIQNRR